MAISSTDCRDRVRRRRAGLVPRPRRCRPVRREAPPLPAAAGGRPGDRGAAMSSGKHRRPEPDALPEVDLASRLATGRQRDDGPRSPRQRRRRAAGCRPSTAGPTPATPPRSRAGRAPAVPGQTVMARRSRAAERAARRRAMRQRVLLVAAAVLGVVLMVVGGWLVLRGSGDGTDAGGGAPGSPAHHPGAGDRSRRHRGSQRAGRHHRQGQAGRCRPDPVPADRRRGRVGRDAVRRGGRAGRRHRVHGGCHGPARCLGRRQLDDDHRRPGRAGRLRGRGPGGSRRRRRHHRRQGQRDRRGAGRQPAA